MERKGLLAGMAGAQDLAHVPHRAEPGGTRDGVFLLAQGMIVFFFDLSARVAMQKDMMSVHGGYVAH